MSASLLCNTKILRPQTCHIWVIDLANTQQLAVIFTVY